MLIMVRVYINLRRKWKEKWREEWRRRKNKRKSMDKIISQYLTDTMKMNSNYRGQFYKVWDKR